MNIQSRPLPPSGRREKIGVIIANLGTPEATDYWSMRRYLNQFLSDKRVIDYPSWKWQPILQGIILNTRPKKSAAAYELIWDHENNESPLMRITRQQAQKIGSLLGEKFKEELIVDFAMRYGQPSIASVLQKLVNEGCDKLIFFPLYPQYASPTTATANDDAFRALMKMKYQPALRTVPAYFADENYLNALSRSLLEGVKSAPKPPTKLVLSYHGVPKRYYLEGDPYYEQCLETTRLVSELSGFASDFVATGFQSKFGKEEWVRPSTVELIDELVASGHKSIAVAAPAFSADCVETLEEIEIRLKEQFLSAGGESFQYIPCLNAHADHISALAHIIESELGAWVSARHVTDPGSS